MDFTIYTDGGSRGNPGPAGAGAVIVDDLGKEIARVAQYLGEQTNNYAEYEAVLLGLRALKKHVPKNKRKEARIELRLDSELVARQLNGEYQVKDESLQLQYMKVHNMRVSDFPHMTVTHIAREQNSIADGLANEAMDAHSDALF